MVNNLASDALYRKYEEEKSLLELYGHVNNLTFENWLDTKKSNKKNIGGNKMTSIINWQTGEPRQDGLYIVSYFDFVQKVNICRVLEKVGYRWINGSIEVRECNIKAWCKLSDIKPYKEE